MTEPNYRLDLTEREREMIVVALWLFADCNPKAFHRANELADKLRALEPIGTGGTTTTEGNG